MFENIIQDTAEQDEEFYEHYRIVADKGQQPLRIDKFLVNRLENASRSRIQNAIKAGSVRVNDVQIKANHKIKPEEVITILLPNPPRDKELKGENIALNIVYEDDYLMIINKPAGMVVHPGYNNYTGTLVNALVYHFDNLPTKNGERRPGLVHRIDKDTTGLLVIAKEDYTMTHLAKQFFEHTIQRTYQALAWGTFEEKEGTIRSNLARSLKDRRVMQSFSDEEIGKHAITHYKVLEEFHYTSLIECKLETGRTHQIRAHMQSVGHPLFADESYGGKDVRYGPQFTRYKQFVQNCFQICPRQALHARSLGFIHPITKENMYFEAPLPDDMVALIDKWKHYVQYHSVTEVE
ncbi:MAG: RluA family pseudouridine synthase [Bacteroidia bacterium]